MAAWNRRIAPAPAVPTQGEGIHTADTLGNLHAQIMNLPKKVPSIHQRHVSSKQAWHDGHKHARHAAAELASVQDARVRELEAESERLRASLAGMLESYDLLVKHVEPSNPVMAGCIRGAFLVEPANARKALAASHAKA